MKTIISREKYKERRDKIMSIIKYYKRIHLEAQTIRNKFINLLKENNIKVKIKKRDDSLIDLFYIAKDINGTIINLTFADVLCSGGITPEKLFEMINKRLQEEYLNLNK